MRLLLATLLAFSCLPRLLAADDQPVPFRGRTYPLVLELEPGQKFGAVLSETPLSEAAAEAYDTVYVQGEMPEPGVRLDLAVNSGVFFLPDQTYRYAAMRRFPDGRFWARYELPSASRSRLKLAAVNEGLRGASAIVLYEVEAADSRETGGPAASTAPFAYVPDPALSVPAGVPFGITLRGGWQALPPKEPFSTHTPVGFVLHHTQGRYPRTYEAAAAEMRFIQDFHQNGRGWNDIGYHFLIDPSGNIFEGRPVGVIGAHVKNKNTGRTGISVMGNYHPPASNPFSDASRDAFVALGSWLRSAYGVQRADFVAHRDLQATDCPGDDLYAKLAHLRGLIFDPALDIAPQQPARGLSPAQDRALLQLMNLLD